MTHDAESVLGLDRYNHPIEPGDWVRFPGTKIEGIAYGVHETGYLLVAVAGYGTYGLWPVNAEFVPYDRGDRNAGETRERTELGK